MAMRKVNLCFEKPVVTEFPNGKRTNKDIKEYQKRYRDAKRKMGVVKV
jgi:hypothetical protein